MGNVACVELNPKRSNDQSTRSRKSPSLQSPISKHLFHTLLQPKPFFSITPNNLYQFNPSFHPFHQSFLTFYRSPSQNIPNRYRCVSTICSSLNHVNLNSLPANNTHFSLFLVLVSKIEAIQKFRNAFVLRTSPPTTITGYLHVTPKKQNFIIETRTLRPRSIDGAITHLNPQIQ